MPSKKYEQVEAEKAEKAQEEQSKAGLEQWEQDRKIYFAPAERFCIANYVKEERDHGRVVRSEESLRFSENLKITSDPKEIAFIESSRPFKNGVIRLCKDMNEAQGFKMQRSAVRAVKEIATSSIERTRPV